MVTILCDKPRSRVIGMAVIGLGRSHRNIIRAGRLRLLGSKPGAQGLDIA